MCVQLRTPRSALEFRNRTMLLDIKLFVNEVVACVRLTVDMKSLLLFIQSVILILVLNVSFRYIILGYAKYNSYVAQMVYQYTLYFLICNLRIRF